MRKIYLFPGLGADERVFSDYQFPDYEKVVIRWLEPEKGETIPDYAERIRYSHYMDTNAIMVGVSFGGMIAAEIAKMHTQSSLALVSSVCNYNEIPFFTRILARSGLIHLVPDLFLRTPSHFLYRLFGVIDPAIKLQLSVIIRNTSPRFLRWAVGAIGKWKGELPANRAFRIHGTADKILPHHKESDQRIPGAGHFMIVEKAPEINELLNEWLLKIPEK